MAVRWDRLAGRVVEVNRKSYFSGAMLLCPRAVADELLSSIAAGAKKLRTELETAAQETGEPLDVTDEALCAFILPQCTPLITHTWLVNVLDRLLGPGPDVRNRDGDELLVSQVRLPLTGDMAAVAARLEYRPEFVRDAADDSNEADEGDEGDEADDFYWSWLDDTTPPLGSEQEDSLALDTTDEGGRTILGSLTLGEDALVLATNSKERAETGSALLATILQGLVGQPLSSYQTPERFIEEHGDELPPGTELPGDVAAAAVHEAIDAHYRQALDQPIPMLDGKTPRQAVKTPAGREQVLYWLKQLENTEGHRAAQQGQQPYDTEWIWRELELDTPQ